MPGKAFTVLLIEDNQAHAELIVRGLQKRMQSCMVCCVANGEAALDYLFRRNEYADSEVGTRPDLVLLDLRLPRVSGFVVLNQIKTSESLKTIPVVILTTSAADTDIEKAYACRANSYLIKPVGFHDFTQLIDNVADYWLDWIYRAWSTVSKQWDAGMQLDTTTAADSDVGMTDA